MISCYSNDDVTNREELKKWLRLVAFAQRTMQTPDPPNLNRCCWVRVYNPQSLPRHQDTHMLIFRTLSPAPPILSMSSDSAEQPRSLRVQVGSGWGEKSTTAPRVVLHWYHTALHECPKLPLTSKWSPCWCLLILPDHGSISTMFDRLCLQCQGRATINAKTLTLYLLKFTVVWRWWLILHLDR